MKAWIAGVTLVAALASAAEATPSYYAEANALFTGGSPLDAEKFVGPLPVTATAGAIDGFSMGSGAQQGFLTTAGDSSASSGRGFVPGGSHTSINVTNHQCCLRTDVRGSNSFATMHIDDVVIEDGTAISNGATVSGILNLAFEGSLAAAAHFANALGSSGGRADVTIGVLLPGFSGLGTATLGVTAPPTNSQSASSSGLLTGYTGGLLDLHVATAALPLNTPFGIELRLDTGTLVGYEVHGTGPNSVPLFAETFSSFTHTFSFATTGPVFTLPDGLTVNSDQGAIENNRFVGLPQQVPAPGTLALLAAGWLVAVAWSRCRRT